VPAWIADGQSVNRSAIRTESILTAAPEGFSGARAAGLRQVIHRWSELLSAKIPEGYENETGFHFGKSTALPLPASPAPAQNIRAV
jgi:hypothetical protein